MGDQYEDSYECLFRIAEINYVFILHVNYTIYVYFYIVYELH
jgi:hypothetical protein